MHEMSIAAAVMEGVEAESARFGGARVAKVGLRVGELSGVEVESLRFCLEIVAQEIEFDIQTSPGTELNFAYMEIEDESAAGTESTE